MEQASGRHQGRCAVVTGAGRGIGRAIAARMLAEGASVALWEIDADAGQDARQELAALGPVWLETLDIADEAAVTAALERTLDWAGGVDVLVNNAVSMRTFGSALHELSMADVRRELEVNLLAPLHLVQQALPSLRARRGSVVNLTSTRALMSEANTFSYAAAKGGLGALTHALAVSLGPEVRVNAVAPGWIATDAWLPRSVRRAPELSAVDHAQHPAGRVGTPEDVAALVAFLASSEAGFITGQIYTVDGGMTRKMIYAD